MKPLAVATAGMPPPCPVLSIVRTHARQVRTVLDNRCPHGGHVQRQPQPRAPGQLLDDLTTADNAQASNVAETIQRVDPDIILINEFDYEANATAVDLFRTNYLEIPHNGAQPVSYPYSWSGSVNTGVPSGFDLDGDGSTTGPSDAWGFGKFPGQYGFVVLLEVPD